MTVKQKETLTALEVMEEEQKKRMIVAEIIISGALKNLPTAPFTAQVLLLGEKPEEYHIQVTSSTGRRVMFRSYTLDEYAIEGTILMVHGTLYTLPPPQPIVDMAVIDKQITTLRQREEHLTTKLTISRKSSAKWEVRATKAEAKLAQIRLMTLAELTPPPDEDVGDVLVIEK